MKSLVYSNVSEMVFRISINYWIFKVKDTVLLPRVIINTALNCIGIYTSQSGNGKVKTVFITLAFGECELLFHDY